MMNMCVSSNWEGTSKGLKYCMSVKFRNSIRF